MAPLKLRSMRGWIVLEIATYPCLKGHGPIEAFVVQPVDDEANMYPCLKGHGPIEAQSGAGMIRWTPRIHA